MSIKRSLARLAHTPPRRLDVAAVRGALPGQSTQTEHGELHLIDEYLEPHHHHGRAPIANALQVSSERLAQLALDPTLEEVDIKRALFFDTETTGLAGGTGTVPFLIGIGWFEDESLRIQQLFLPELGREAPMLHWLRERITRSSCLVSFNGKTFDWPLLRSRFVMNRVCAPELPPHLDLLHCARRILRRRLRSIRLVELEREVLGMYREDDVSGALIPQLYFDYLDGGDVSPIARVIEHNANDLIALAALVAELVSHFDEVHGSDDPRDHLAYARVAERTGDRGRARSFARAAADGGGEAACTVEACLLTARMARRGGDVDDEERALLEALRAADDDELRAMVQLMLSKHYEHRRKDPERALEHATGTALAEGDEATERRVARLERRLARQA
ncbi:MAG: ribonuclease H-like domain-containing protein [Myxococcales bacterium]|nr:ribonuclease H-like domain-containing protein [Myxococcales bacterium]